MRRYTLCKLCFAALSLILLLSYLKYPPGVPLQDIPEGWITAYGVVAGIEEKEKDTRQAQVIISLHSVAFCDGNFQSENNQNYQISDGASHRGRADNLLCYMAEGMERPCIGERIIVAGEASGFEESRNPGGFDALSYYQSRGIAFALWNTRLLQGDGRCSRYRQTLYEWRQHLAQTLDEVCGGDAAVMRAMLLGDKGFLPSEIKKLYQKGGISHILAISGLHISFLGMGLYRLLKRLGLPIPAAAVSAGVFLGSYVVMSGQSPSSCRAAIMFGISLAADLCRRSYDRMTALSVSALLLALSQPLVLRQSGFLLSYGAILGLELGLPIWLRLWKNRIMGLFAAGISVSAVTLPVILSVFFEFPVYSFLLNLFVIPAMGAVMALGVLSLLAGTFSAAVGRLLFLPVHFLLWSFQAGCRLTGALPGSAWITGRPSAWRIAMYCALLLLFCLIGRYMTRPCALLLLCGGLWILTASCQIGDTVTMLDVGQGDGLVLRSGRGSAILIDGGSSSEKELAEYTLLPYLKSQGIDSLDYVFLTHMDADHINGTEELIERGGEEGIRIHTLVLPALQSPDEDYMRIADKALAAGIRICRMGRGERIAIDDLEFLCLHPDREAEYADRNASSLVLYVRSGTFSALLTGDLDGEAEAAFAAEYPDACGGVTLLKVGHHGSKASCSAAFLQKIRPRLAFVSCGERNSYGHPNADTLERLGACGSGVYVTKDTGAIILRIWRGRVRVETYLPGRAG